MTNKANKQPISKPKVLNKKPPATNGKQEPLLKNKRKFEDKTGNEGVANKKQKLAPNGPAAAKKKFEKKEDSGKKPSFNDKKKAFLDKNKKAVGIFKGKKSPNGQKGGSGDAVLTKKEKKELKQQRRKKKLGEDNYEMAVVVKKIWETLRRADTTEDTKKALSNTLYEKVKGKIAELAMAHDTCRVIECLVKYGNEKVRETVYTELKSHFLDLAKSKYGRFMLKKMLQYGSPEQKNAIVNAFTGQVPKLIRHSYACKIVEAIYNEHADHNQRNQMIMEFYDPQLAIFQEKKYKSLQELLESQPASRAKILSNIKDTLTKCIDKTLLLFSIVHRVFNEYFQNCNSIEKLEMIELLSEHLVHMLHTKDGARVTMQCIWHGSAKERKKIIKGFKSFMQRIACEEHGHQVLLAIFDCVDDTKLVNDAVLKELFRGTRELLENEYGRKVLTYLVARRDTRFFLKDYLARLEPGVRLDTSKKDTALREKELAEYALPHFRDYITKEMSSLLYNGAAGILVPVVLSKLNNDDRTKCLKVLANLLLQKPIEEEVEVSGGDDKNKNYIEDATSHYIVKQILHQEKENKDSEKTSLVDVILEHENLKNIRSWISCNRGCFILVNLIEACNDENKKKKLKVVLGDDGAKASLTKSKFAGSKILLKKLDEIK